MRLSIYWLFLAFPDDYVPTPRSLIGALYRKGVSVAELATRKAVDLRQTFSCWLSEEVVTPVPGIQFRRILCFEPLTRGAPPKVVGDIFRSLMPFLLGDPPITRIAMPLVATGNQNVPLIDMLEPLLDAAAHWLAVGAPVERLKIVEYAEVKAAELKGAFSILKRQYEGAFLNRETTSKPDATPGPVPEQPSPRDQSSMQVAPPARSGPVLSNSSETPSEVSLPVSAFKYDLFISYSHRNREDIVFFAEELQRQRPDIRIFLDRKDLNTGMAWQRELYKALDDCCKVVTLYSQPYLESEVCQEELHIAIFRDRESNEQVLFPIYLYDAALPTYLQLKQYTDCRNANREKLKEACAQIVASLSG